MTANNDDVSLNYDQFTGRTKKQDAHFLWWCAGAHQDLLKAFPSEHSKYAGLGGVLLATFALAALSAGYAVYSVFDHWLWAIGFGLIWGLIIFNFDRFLVSTMRKYGVSKARQWWMTLPRIALAVLIGFTIARPLELKVFEKEIDVKVMENRHKKILLNDSLLQSEYAKQLTAATGERERLGARKLNIEDSLHQLQQAYVQEADGTAGSRQRGIDKLTRLKQEAYQQAMIQYAPELVRLREQIAGQDSLIAGARGGLEQKRAAYESGLASKVGFLERNKALSDLSEQEPSVFWANLFISLLIILIETGPILSKMIMPVGPYDVALAKEELLRMAHSENEMLREKQLNLGKLEEIYRSKKAFSDELIEKYTSLQKKHAFEELDSWERGERLSPSRIPLNEMARKIAERYDYEEKHVI